MRTRRLYYRSLTSAPHPRSWPFAATALLLASGFLSATASDEPQGPFDHWSAQALGLEGCVRSLERSENAFPTAVDCVKGQAISRLFDAAIQYFDQHGKALFGEHFRLDHRVDFSTSGGGLRGDLDAVIPVNSFTSISDDRVTRATFFQNGLSRWWDEYGFQRTDARFGIVHRMSVSEQFGAGVFGTSVFLQENLERGHERIVTGLDYSGGWGRGSLSYFMPLTDWRTGRFGYEERALEGVELELRADVTNAIELRAAAGRWEDKDGSGDWNTRGRLGVQWQLHSRVGLRGNWEDLGTAGDSLGLHMVVAIPFGGSDRQRGRWQGLGRANLDSGQFDPGAIWNSVDNVVQIEVAERNTAPEDEPDEPVIPEIVPMFDQLITSQQ